MQIITKKDLIRDVAKRWREQYPRGYKYLSGDCSADGIYTKLKNLLNNATEKDVEKIIGNGSWTENECEECGVDSEVIIIFESEFDDTFRVCEKCLKKALRMIRDNGDKSNEEVNRD